MEVLKRCPLLQGLSENACAQARTLCRAREYPRDAHLIMPQDTIDGVGILVSGRIRLLHLSPEGEGQLMNVVLPSGLLGADLICTRTRQAPYHAQAATAVKLLFLPADVILKPGQLPEEDRQHMVQNLLTYLSDSNMKKEYRLAILSQRGVRERVMTYLTMQVGKRGSNTVTVPFSREELASFLCVNRSALSHELSKMEQDGLIKFRKNQFTVLRGN